MSDETRTLIRLQYPNPRTQFLDFYHSMPEAFLANDEARSAVTNALYFYYKKDLVRFVINDEYDTKQLFEFWISRVVDMLEAYIDARFSS